MGYRRASCSLGSRNSGISPFVCSVQCLGVTASVQTSRTHGKEIVLLGTLCMIQVSCMVSLMSMMDLCMTRLRPCSGRASSCTELTKTSAVWTVGDHDPAGRANSRNRGLGFAWPEGGGGGQLASLPSPVRAVTLRSQYVPACSLSSDGQRAHSLGRCCKLVRLLPAD